MDSSPTSSASSVGAPAALRAYVRFRTELRHGVLPRATVERIGLAVATMHGAEPDLTQHARGAREAGIGIDEIRRARQWGSADERQAALLRWLAPLAEHDRVVPDHLHEEAIRRPARPTSSCSRPIGVVALESFSAMVDVAGEVPIDGSSESTRQLRAVA